MTVKNKDRREKLNELKANGTIDFDKDERLLSCPIENRERIGLI